jgi:hypothetical protein
LSDFKIGKHKVTSGIFETFSKAGDGEALAGRATDEEIDFFIGFPFHVLSHIPKVRDFGVMMVEDCRREFINFRESDRLPVKMVPSCGGCFYPRTH